MDTISLVMEQSLPTATNGFHSHSAATRAADSLANSLSVSSHRSSHFGAHSLSLSQTLRHQLRPLHGTPWDRRNPQNAPMSRSQSRPRAANHDGTETQPQWAGSRSGPGQGVNGKPQAPLGEEDGPEMERKAEAMFLEEMSRVARPGSGEGEGRAPKDPKGYEMGLVSEEAHRDENSALTSALTFLSQSQMHLSRVVPSSAEGQGSDEDTAGGSGSDSESDSEADAGTRGPVPGEGEGGVPAGEGASASPSAFRWAQSLMSQLTSRVSDLEQGLKEREEVRWMSPVMCQELL